MAPPKRKVLITAEETLIPPNELSETQQIARVVKATGNNVYLVELPSSTTISIASSTILVELPSRFRSTIWIKRGSYVVIDTEAYRERENKLSGEVINIVRDEKAWRKAAFWPKEFVKQSLLRMEVDDEDSTVGKMPPSDESDVDAVEV